MNLRGVTDTIALVFIFKKIKTLNEFFRNLADGYTDLRKNLMKMQKLIKLEDGIPLEQSVLGTEVEVSSAWPQTGAIKFTDVTCKYRSELEPMLRGLNFEIEGERKVGVIGKSGSGKTTAFLTLSRIIELTSGKIEIDGVDISKINLRKLRNNITVIPQHCTIFKETLKFNLDPTGKATDLEMSTILKKVGLGHLLERENPKIRGWEKDPTHYKQKIEKDGKGLYCKWLDGGKSLTTG